MGLQMGLKPPWNDFSLAEIDVIQKLREKLSDQDIIIRWQHINASKHVKKTSTQVKEYLTRNPRGQS